MKRIKAVSLKETFHIIRDPRSLAILFLLPVVMILVLGYSLSFDLDQIKTGIIDYSQGELSNTLIQKFSNSDYYSVTQLVQGHEDQSPEETAEERLKSGNLQQVIIIPQDFSSNINKGQISNIGVIIDGSDSNIANIIHQYNEMLVFDFISEIQDIRDILNISTKLYFNPENKSAFYIIPGLVAVIMIMISALLTSLSVAREKETGSIELLFISPLKSTEIVIGKTIPYVFISLMEGAVILIFARMVFHIPFQGSMWILLMFSLVYIVTGLSLGITLSTIAKSQKVAMMTTLLITLLPSILLSGFIFPLDSLSPLLRTVSYLVPATYFLEVIRGVILKGAALRHFAAQGLILVGFSLFFLSIASVRFSQLRKAKK
ncbi:MAG: ABC transporter permease subunit [Candidatus Aminicenantes bacterium]|nr:ABC transporter permease subunit [Candidatus Aminicenantes bacterium]